jgi:hypothetical protein
LAFTVPQAAWTIDLRRNLPRYSNGASIISKSILHSSSSSILAFLNPGKFNHTSGNHKIQDQEDEKKYWRQKPGISTRMETQIPAEKGGERTI